MCPATPTTHRRRGRCPATVSYTHLLSRVTKELVLCYDNDKAGQMATDRALELLENTEFKVKVLRLPQRLVDGQYVKQDADDFIKYQGQMCIRDRSTSLS